MWTLKNIEKSFKMQNITMKYVKTNVNHMKKNFHDFINTLKYLIYTLEMH